jgi:hypothetical protein
LGMFWICILYAFKPVLLDRTDCLVLIALG